MLFRSRLSAFLELEQAVRICNCVSPALALPHSQIRLEIDILLVKLAWNYRDRWEIEVFAIFNDDADKRCQTAIAAWLTIGAFLKLSKARHHAVAFLAEF